jgi:hypothetical protein
MKTREVKWIRPILLGVIAAVEFIIIYLNWPTIWPFLQGNSELRLLSTIIPILLSAPFAYSIWTWRDHDKQRIMNYDESRLALDTKKNSQETERWEHDIVRLKFEARIREVDKQEEENTEKETELKITTNELAVELDSLKNSGVIVPKINSNLEKFMKSQEKLGALDFLAANDKKNEELEKHWKSEEHKKLSEAIEALKAIEVLKAESLKNKDSEENKKALGAMEFESNRYKKDLEAMKFESNKYKKNND